MSVESVHAAIKRFLASPEPEVLCIRGHWGTGKTYTWQKIAREQRNVGGGVALNEYSYVSLFGLSSIAELKTQILQNTVLRNQIGDVTDVSTFSNFLSSLERAGKKTAMQALQVVPGKAGDVIVSSMSLFTNKQIICLDDFERKGDKLTDGDVLGFISYLKEERKCKVVLLLNDKRLGDRKTFDAYLEKVVDVYLTFEPTSDEIVNIALLEADHVSALVRGNVQRLGINNIRVIRKILRLVREVAPMLEGYSEQVLIDAARSITLLGWSFLQPESGPPLEYLKTVNVYTPRSDETAKDMQWRDILRNYPHTHTSKFDLALLRGVENGYFVKAEIDEHAGELHQADAREKARVALRQIWAEFFGSFHEVDDEVLNRFFSTYMASAAYVTTNDMISLEILFRELGDERSTAILDRFIELNIDNLSAFDTDHILSVSDRLPETVVLKFKEAAEKQRPTYSSEEVLLALEKHGFEEEKTIAAAALDEGEYLRIFKTLKGEPLDLVLAGIRQYLRISNNSAHVEEILEKSARALRIIAVESPANKIKVLRLGIVQRLDQKEAYPAKTGEHHVMEMTADL